MDREDELTTLIKLSEETGIPIDTLRRAAQRGSLIAKKMGRDWVATRGALKAWQAYRRMGRPPKK